MALFCVYYQLLCLASQHTALADAIFVLIQKVFLVKHLNLPAAGSSVLQHPSTFHSDVTSSVKRGK